jgi:uncharacterized BrkB/YihY/UPF0761 family membrane protein
MHRACRPTRRTSSFSSSSIAISFIIIIVITTLLVLLSSRPMAPKHLVIGSAITATVFLFFKAKP